MIYTLFFSLFGLFIWVLILEIGEQYWSDKHCPAQRNSYTPKTNKPKIAFMGGSTTFGFSLPEEHTFPYILEKMINGKMEVINLGVSGDTIEHTFNRIDDCVKHKPEIIFISPLWNNMNYMLMSATMNVNTIKGKFFYYYLNDLRDGIKKVFGNNYFSIILWRILRRVLSVLFVRTKPVDLYVVQIATTKYKESLESVIKELIFKAGGAQICFLLTPSRVSVVGRTSKDMYLWGMGTVNIFNNVPIYTEIMERGIIAELSKQYNITVVDTYMALKTSKNKNKLFIVDDYHFTKTGNEIIAKVIYNLLEE